MRGQGLLPAGCLPVFAFEHLFRDEGPRRSSCHSAERNADGPAGDPEPTAHQSASGNAFL